MVIILEPLSFAKCLRVGQPSHEHLFCEYTVSNPRAKTIPVHMLRPCVTVKLLSCWGLKVGKLSFVWQVGSPHSGKVFPGMRRRRRVCQLEVRTVGMGPEDIRVCPWERCVSQLVCLSEHLSTAVSLSLCVSRSLPLLYIFLTLPSPLRCVSGSNPLSFLSLRDSPSAVTWVMCFSGVSSSLCLCAFPSLSSV